MHIGRDRGLGQPENRAELRARGVDGDPIRGSHQGQRHARRAKQAGHMSAPDRAVISIIFPLRGGGRPHMTRFRGHRTVCVQGVHDGQDKIALRT